MAVSSLFSKRHLFEEFLRTTSLRWSCQEHTVYNSMARHGIIGSVCSQDYLGLNQTCHLCSLKSLLANLVLRIHLTVHQLVIKLLPMSKKETPETIRNPMKRGRDFIITGIKTSGIKGKKDTLDRFLAIISQANYSNDFLF